MIAEPNCNKRKCKWFMGVHQPDGTEETERVICLAYPEGIPVDIAYGDNKHTETAIGQQGNFVYEQETGNGE